MNAPHGSLPANLAAFCQALRREYGFRLGAEAALDAARSLEAIDSLDERSVRNALRPVLSGSMLEAAAFDEAFTAFFRRRPPRLGQSGSSDDAALDRGTGASEGEGTAEGRAAPGATLGADSSEGEAALEPRPPGDTSAGAVAMAERARRSLLEGEGHAAVVLSPVDADWRQAASALVRRAHVGVSRRWRPARRGSRFDLRRTLRASLHTGGEALSPRWLRRLRRAPRFVVLVDGSRSMGSAEATGLEIATAIAAVTRRIEVFTFSTTLQRVTPAVRRAASGRASRLQWRRDVWGGGTSIGASLRRFLQLYGERMLGRDVVVIVVSDGLDAGDPGTLADALRELRRRSAGIVWLNHLIDTPGYEPTSSGMSTAMPHITTFASVTDARGLARLSRRIRVRS